MGKLLATLTVAIAVIGIFIVFGGSSAPATARLAVMRTPPASVASEFVLDADGGRAARQTDVAACPTPCLPDKMEMGTFLVNERPEVLRQPQG